MGRERQTPSVKRLVREKGRKREREGMSERRAVRVKGREREIP